MEVFITCQHWYEIAECFPNTEMGGLTINHAWVWGIVRVLFFFTGSSNSTNLISEPISNDRFVSMVALSPNEYFIMKGYYLSIRSTYEYIRGKSKLELQFFVAN